MLKIERHIEYLIHVEGGKNKKLNNNYRENDEVVIDTSDGNNYEGTILEIFEDYFELDTDDEMVNIYFEDVVNITAQN